MSEDARNQTSPRCQSRTLPDRPKKLTVDYRENEQGIVVRHGPTRTSSPFLMLWFLGWSFTCMTLLADFLGDPSWGALAFCIPFFVTWLITAGVIIWTRYGEETLVLREDGVIFQRTAILELFSKTIPRKDVKKFNECQSEHTENELHVFGIELETFGLPVRFAYRLPKQERHWLIHQLNSFIGAETSIPEDDETIIEPIFAPRFTFWQTSEASRKGTQSHVERMTLENTTACRPRFSRCQLHETPDGFAIEQSGTFRPLGIVFVLPVVALSIAAVVGIHFYLWRYLPVNNTVSGWEWWALLVVSMSFAAIGLAGIFLLILICLEPFSRSSWLFRESRLIRRTPWLFHFRTESWEISPCFRLEIRAQQPDFKRLRHLVTLFPDLTHQSPCRLVFLEPNHGDVCEIDNLNEPEARWLANEILKRCPKGIEQASP